MPISILLIAFLCIAPLTVLPDVLRAQSEVNRREKYEYQGILELWHVESFEGGSASRLTFLEREAIDFEKSHKGTYISIQSMSIEQVALNFQNGKTPNMISFGIGVGEAFANNLVELNTVDIRQDIALGGRYGSKQVAIPYILGGYAIISNGTQETGVGCKGPNNPLKALQKNDMQISNFFEDLEMDSYNAYDKFIKGNFSTLVGTQRDVYRCFNRQQKGLMQNLQFTFLSNYTDLVQYISVFKGSAIEQQLCEKFAQQLTSQNVQKKLKDYNLFSVLKDTKLYTDGLYNDFENTLKKSLVVENVFLSQEQIKTAQQDASKSVIKN